MWELFGLNFPALGRGNYNTIPSAGVTVGTDTVTIELPAHSLYRRNYVGSFYLNLRTAIPTGTTATLPINICSNGVALPLMEKGLKIRLCRNALNDNNLTEADLWPGVEVVPAGLVEIVRLQQAGFAYIKP